MRLVRFCAAMSLDGYIAGLQGEHDWILPDPDVDFAASMARFDTFLIGRKTFEMMQRAGRESPPPGIQYIVCSSTLKAADFAPGRVVSDAAACVKDLSSRLGKDIAVFGGGELFRSLLAAGLVDRLEVSVVPVLLGGGVPLLPAPAARAGLRLRGHRIYPRTGTAALDYEVVRG